MDAVFFIAERADACRVGSSSELLSDPVGDPLRLADPMPLVGLAEALGVEHRVRPLRDATCRSFPVWDLGREIPIRLAVLDETEIDETAEQWHKSYPASFDADLYELTTCLTDLREASCEVLRNAMGEGNSAEALFVLLEERAF